MKLKYIVQTYPIVSVLWAVCPCWWDLLIMYFDYFSLEEETEVPRETTNIIMTKI